MEDNSTAEPVPPEHALDVSKNYGLLNAAVTSSYNAVVITTATLNAPGPQIIYVNPAFETMTGYSASDVLGQTPRMLQGERTCRLTLDAMRAALERGEGFSGSIINYRRDGTPYHLEWSVSPVRDAHGVITHFMSLQRDITESIHNQQARDQLLSALEEIADEVIITDAAGMMTYVNRAFRQRTGKDSSAVLGTPAPPLLPGRHEPDSLASLWHRLENGETEVCTFQETDSQSRVRHLEYSIAPVTDTDGRILQYVLTGRDVSDRLAAEQELKRLATTDKLTGLNNRLRFEEIIEQEMERSRRNERPFALSLFDIDDFKAVNDTYGHEAGDALLRELATLLIDNTRAPDHLGRWGGEEFTLLLPETSAQAARGSADKLRRLVESRELAGLPAITVSFGITGIAPGDTLKSLLRRADLALYQAKNNGKNRVEVQLAP